MVLTKGFKINSSAAKEGGSSMWTLPPGVYNAEISDITYIPAEDNPYGDKPQLKVRFNILDEEYSGAELLSWISLTMNAGWEQGNPSNLYKVALAVLKKEPDLEKEFYPEVLLGGKLKVVVETRKKKNGQGEYSKITNYLMIPVKKEGEEDA